MPFAGTATAASPTLPLSIPALAPAPRPRPPASPPRRPPGSTCRSRPRWPRTRRWPPGAAAASRCCRWRSARPACPPIRRCATRWRRPRPATVTARWPACEALRSAAAGYWQRRGLPTSPGSVVCGPGSKPLLFGLLLAADADVAVPRPSWVSYAAQASLIGARAHFVAAAPGEGGICDPAALAPVGHRGPGRRAGDPVGGGHAAGQPDRAAAPAGHGAGVLRGGRRARPDHHLRRDLPRPGARPRRRRCSARRRWRRSGPSSPPR